MTPRPGVVDEVLTLRRLPIPARHALDWRAAGFSAVDGLGFLLGRLADDPRLRELASGQPAELAGRLAEAIEHHITLRARREDGPLPPPAPAEWLDALKGLALARVRENPDDGTARLWAALEARRPDDRSWWRGRGGLPADAGARAVLDAVDGWAASAREVLFPVAFAGPDGTPGAAAALLRCRVTRLPDRPELDGLPRVLLAPWSPVHLHPREARPANESPAQSGGLGPALEAAAPAVGEFVRRTRLMVELAPLPADLPGGLRRPPGVAVEGESLGLAVVLAAWAAHAGRQLRTLVATGRVTPAGVGGVGHTAGSKWDAVRGYREAAGRPRVPYLIPAVDHAPALAGDGLHVERVDTWAGLFARQALLTDGFDAYREALAGSAAAAPDPALDRLAARVAAAPAVHVEPLDFGRPPTPAGVYLVRRLAGEVGALGNPADRPVPVLLPLHAPAPPAPSPAERLLTRVRDGLRLLGGPAAGAVPDDLLRDTLGTDPGKLLLVVVSRPSAAIDYAAESAALAALAADFAAVRPGPAAGVVVLASDLHHDHLVREAWAGGPCGAVLPPAPPLPTGPP